MTSFVLAVLLAGAGAGEPVKPKMPLGKDTTVAEGPLTAEGFIDYSKALQERLGKGVTAETNAVVLLWQASGPKPEGGNGMHPDFFAALKMTPPPEEGDYMIGSGKFARDTLKLMPMQVAQFDEEMQKLTRQPWSENEHPNVAALLNANAKPLAIVAEASKRRDYFNPLVSSQKEGEPNMLIGALLPQVQKCREYVYFLSIRTMLRLEEKNYDAAWQDIMTMQRLARLMSRGATLIEYLVAVAIEAISHQATYAYLEHAPLTAAQVQAKWKEIE